VGEKIAIGDYGEFSFTIRKKRKYPLPDDKYIETVFILVGEVTDTDRGNIEIKDNDGLFYIVERNRLRYYEKMKRHEN